MLLIPAIVIRDGKCAGAGVIPESASAPAEALRVADAWIAGGVRRLHVMDGDVGKPAGTEVIRTLTEAHPDLAIQAAGNFRSGDEVERYLSAGAEYVLLDAKAAGAGHFVNDLCFEYPGHVLMTMEARSGKVATGGWSKLTRHPLEEAARRFQQDGVAGIVYRAAAEAGAACNIVPAVELAGILTIPVLAAGELKSFTALADCCAVVAGLAGMVLGVTYRDDPGNFAAAVQLAERVPATE